ncbi:citrate lyase subunit alpha [bacterium]|nr:citrate lyase subunit alpha [bacterium]
MKNKLGVKLPDHIDGIGKILPYKGPFARVRGLKKEGLTTTGVKMRSSLPGKKKVFKDLKKVIELSGLKDGGTISFHHHLRNGDFLLMNVMKVLDEMGFKDLILSPSSLTSAHQGIVDYVRKGVVKRICTSGLRGELGKFISKGNMEIPVVIRSHGGRARAIKSGDVKIDVAFIGAPSSDREGNLNGVRGPSACGSLGYAMVDAEYADCVIAVTDHLVDYPNTPISIPQYQVDYIVLTDKLGNPDKIGSGSTRLTTNPVDHIIAEKAAKLIFNSGYFGNGMTFQTGAGGASLAVAKYVADIMEAKGVVGSYAIGGISSYIVDIYKRGLFKKMFDVQSFDKGVVSSLLNNEDHLEISADFYANPFNSGAIINNLDVVVLAAYEIDTDFNVNVLVDSHGYAQGASGGHSDTSAAAKLTVIVAPSFRARIPTLVDRVNTIITPGETVDILVTERGIAVNPKRKDLLENFKGKGLNIIDICDLKKKVDKITLKPRMVEFGDKICGLIEYRDGTIIDTIDQVIE